MDTSSHYAQIAQDARRKVLDMVFAAQTSHIGSNFSVIDILTVLYEKAKLNPWEERDRIILSKGWAAASLYYFLARHNIIPKEDLETYCKPGSKYIGLAEPTIKGIEAAGGSMGHGMPMGIGMALAFKKDSPPEFHYLGSKVYVVMSDGEMNCGTTWESAMIAKHHNLNNLIVFVDVNGWQAMGRTSEILNQGDLHDKWRAFGWNVFEIDGHDYGHLEHVIDTGPLVSPTVVLCKTTKGKGVSFMEDDIQWHYRNIPEDLYKKAKEELCAV